MTTSITFHDKNSELVKNLQSYVHNIHRSGLDEYHLYAQQTYWKLFWTKYKYIVMTSVELVVMTKKDKIPLSNKKKLTRSLYYDNDSLSDKYVSSKLSFIIRYKPKGITLNNNIFDSLAHYFMEEGYPRFCIEEILYIKTLSVEDQLSMVFHTESAAPKNVTKNVLKGFNKQYHSIIIDISYEFTKEIISRVQLTTII